MRMLLLLLTVAFAVAGQTISGTIQPAGGPPAPIPDSPAAQQSLSGPALQFRWHAAAGVTPSRYEICIAEVAKPCTDAMNAVVLRTIEDIGRLANPGTAPVPGGTGMGPSTQITATSYDVRLPDRFQGRRIQWSVTGCANVRPPNAIGVQERCTASAPRPMTWPLPAPILVPRADLKSRDPSALRPALGIQKEVRGAEYYLYCVSKPGVACPTGPVSSLDTLVVASSGPIFIPAADLTQFESRAMHWTAAACNASLGCVYQGNVQDVSFPRIGPVPAAPVLVTPTVNSWVSRGGRPARFTWQPVPGAASYRLCVSPVGVACGTGGSVVFDGLTTTSFEVTIPASLARSRSTVHWTAAACNAYPQCNYQQVVRPLRLLDTTQERLSVLSYNTFMRPGGFPYFVCTECPPRARLIPGQLMGRGYDVILLQELFDDGFRDTILDGLRGEFPHQSRLLGTASPGVWNGGVVIVSRWPISAQSTRLYNGACAGGDCSADKGVLYVKIDRNGRPYHLFATHTDAGEGAGDLRARDQQFHILRGFIDSKNISDLEPVIIGGDLNVIRDAATGARSAEFTSMAAILNADFGQPIGPLQVTYESGMNPLTEDPGRFWLDYVSTSRTHLHPAIATVEVRTPRSSSPYNSSNYRDLSDHYAVHGMLTFDYPR